MAKEQPTKAQKGEETKADEPVAVKVGQKKAQIEVPEKGKVKVAGHITPGLVLGKFKDLSVNVTVPRNLDPPSIGSEIDVAFQDVVEGHAVEANQIPKD